MNRREELAKLVRSQGRDRSERDAIRLGGQSARDAGTAEALALEVLGDVAADQRCAAIQVEQWRALLADVGFTERESAYVILRSLEKVSPSSLREETGWSRAEIARLRGSIHQKIVGLRTRRPSVSEHRAALEVASGGSFRETLPSGRRMYSMRIPEPFPIQNNLKALENPLFSGGHALRPPLATGERMLEQKLQQARLDVARVWTEITKAKDDLAEKQLMLTAARKDLEADEENSVLAGRLAEPKLVKRVSDAEVGIQAAEKRLEICRRADARAQEAVSQLEGEIQAGRFDRFRAEIEPAAARLRSSQEQYVQDALEVDAIVRKYGQAYNSAAVIFPGIAGDDRISQTGHRNWAVSLLNAALQFAQYQFQLGYRKVS